MKEIPSDHLVSGNIYADIETDDTNLQTILKYVGSDNENDLFTYVSGYRGYNKNKNGEIAFSKGGSYYEV